MTKAITYGKIEEKEGLIMKKYTYFEVFRKIKEVFDRETVEENRDTVKGLEAFVNKFGTSEDSVFTYHTKSEFPPELHKYVQMVEKDRLATYLQMQFEELNNVKAYASFVNTMLVHLQNNYPLYRTYISDDVITYIENQTALCVQKVESTKRNLNRYIAGVLEQKFSELNIDKSATSLTFPEFNEDDFAKLDTYKFVELFVGFLETMETEFEFFAKRPQVYSNDKELGESAFMFEEVMEDIKTNIQQPILQAVSKGSVPQEARTR